MKKLIVALFSLICVGMASASNLQYRVVTEKTSVYYNRLAGETMYLIRTDRHPILFKQKQTLIGNDYVSVKWYKYNLDSSKWEEIDYLINMEF